MKICHVTSVHKPEDIRIFHKECISLVNAGYEVYLVEQGDTYDLRGVHILGIGTLPPGKIRRILFASKRAYRISKKLDCDVYHLHDPELLPYAMKLKRQRKTVVFDSHEDVPGQIIDKEWIPKPFRKAISFLYRVYESHVVKRCDAVVTATSHIAESFTNRAKRVVVINNYPKLDDIKYHSKPFKERARIIAYAGGLNEIRGKSVLQEAMKEVDGILVVACNHEIKTEGNIRYIGQKDRVGVNELYGSARAGVVIYQPAANHIESQPIKLFELMAAGLPVVASDFPLWKKIIENNHCGICVNPCKSSAVQKACEQLLSEPIEAQRMGEHGRRSVEDKYNWKIEEKKLLNLYQQFC